MSVRARGDRLLGVLCNLLLLPARLVEEGLHTLAAYPWAEAVIIRLEPGADVAETTVQYREGTPRWAVGLAHVFPELVAAGVGLLTIAWWLTGGPVPWPETTTDWLLLWFVGAQYLAVAAPEQGSVGGGG